MTAYEFYEKIDEEAVDSGSHRLAMYDMATYYDIEPEILEDGKVKELYKQYFIKAKELKELGSSIFKILPKKP